MRRRKVLSASLISEVNEEAELAGITELIARTPSVPLLVVTDCAVEEFALRVVQAGAQDCGWRAELTAALLGRSARRGRAGPSRARASG